MKTIDIKHAQRLLEKYWSHVNKKITTIYLGIFLFVLTVPAVAQVAFGIECPQGFIYIAVFDMCLNFGQATGLAVSWALILGTLIALAQFAIGAVRMITSSGQPGRLQNARETVTDAVVGLVLIASAWVLLGFIGSTLPATWGINFFVLPFGSGGP
jgi:hypothetical protein